MINIIAVGKIKESSLKSLIQEYVKRLGGYTKLNIIEVDDEPNENTNVKEKEGERILKQIKKDSYVILLDLAGKQIDSLQLASKIDEINTYHSSNITFIIGGSLGVSEEVRQQANYCWQLSLLTFPHNLARLLLFEQLYRAYKILNNETYHK